MTEGAQASESALLIPVPNAEAAVQHWRQQLDPASHLGVPAHVTVLYPFLPPAALDGAAITRVANVFQQRPAFAFSLTRVAWFGNQVAYVQPEPSAVFRGLTAAVVDEFPAYLPYRGAYDDVVPHLTIGQDAPVADLQDAAKNVAGHLPIAARADEIWLMVGTRSERSWHTHTRFEFARTGGRRFRTQS
jgi:2'-5' RNA ligase